MKKTKLYYNRKDTEKFSDTNCQILDDALTGADEFSSQTF